MTQWIKIGVVAKAHGLRGLFFISGRDEIIPPACTALKIGNSIETAIAYEIESSKAHAGRIVLKLKNCQTRDMADEIKAQDIWMELEYVECGEDEYLWGDLIGRTVFDKDGKELGKVIDVANYGASDIVIVEGEDSRKVDLALVENFFDMSFEADTQKLQLVVSADFFGDLWHD